jgi:hypothetical protein
MTDAWEPIELIPDELKDGRKVWVKRVYEGRTIAEGYAVFGVAHDEAPQRQPLGLDPLGRLSSADYVRESSERRTFADEQKWLKPDRMYSFPTPTHFHWRRP